jgi:hypothetical protein
MPRRPAPGTRAPFATRLPPLVAMCCGADGARAAWAAQALAVQLTSEDAQTLAAAVAAGAPRALAHVLGRGDVSDDALEAALSAVTVLCTTTPPGAEAFLAAGGLPAAAALLRSAAPAVSGAAVMALLSATDTSDAAKRWLAADVGAVAALTALMEPPAAAGGGPFADGRPYNAAALLCRLSAPALHGQHSLLPRTPVAAAVVRAGGVPLAVGILRGVLEGGDPRQSAMGSALLVRRLAVFCAGEAAALRAARDAGALPLVARALARAAKRPEPEHAATLDAIAGYLHDLMAASPADDVAALASRPALPAALAAALGRAAGGAAAGECSPRDAQDLAQSAVAVLLLLLLLHGAPPGHAAASSFARAGGAAHLVRAPARTQCLVLLAACVAVGCSGAGAPHQPAGSSAPSCVCACASACAPASAFACAHACVC